MPFLLLLSLSVTTLLYSGIQEQYIVAIPKDNFRPHYFKKDGKLKGVVPDIIAAFSKDAGLNIRFVALPIKRYMKMLVSGEVDFIVPSNPNWGDGSLEEIKFSKPFMASRSAYIKRKDSTSEKIYSIATPSGYIYPAIPAKFMKQSEVKLYETHDSTAALKMLEIGRADVAYVHIDFAKNWAGENWSQFAVREELGFADNNYHISTIKHQHILSKFDIWLGSHQSIPASIIARYR